MERGGGPPHAPLGGPYAIDRNNLCRTLTNLPSVHGLTVQLLQQFSFRGTYPDLIQVPQQAGGVLVDAVRPRAL
jgi:hypothetical protein